MNRCYLLNVLILMLSFTPWFGATVVNAAGTIIVQFGGEGSPQFTVSGYPEEFIPPFACGFRLEAPGGWDEGWHFAAGTAADILENYSNDGFPTVPDGPDAGNAPDLPAYIQMTGPIQPQCDDNLYFFATPISQVLANQEAPVGANYFVADYFDADDIVWLNGSGEVAPVPEPWDPDKEVPELCEVWPDLCEPDTPVVDIPAPDALLDPTDCTSNPFGPHCPPPYDHIGRAVQMLTALIDSGELADFHLKTIAGDRTANPRSLGMSVDLFRHLSENIVALRTEMRAIPNQTEPKASNSVVQKLLLSASASTGRVAVETQTCADALKVANSGLLRKGAVARTHTERARARCNAVVRAADRARDALLRLSAIAIRIKE